MKRKIYLLEISNTHKPTLSYTINNHNVGRRVFARRYKVS